MVELLKVAKITLQCKCFNLRRIPVFSFFSTPDKIRTSRWKTINHSSASIKLFLNACIHYYSGINDCIYIILSATPMIYLHVDKDGSQTVEISRGVR